MGVLSCIGLAIYLPPTSWMRFVGWLFVGLLVYIFYGYNHSRLHHDHAAGGPPLPPGFNPEQQLPEKDVHAHRSE
jgi:APA family basic amino acid/polyamine antiporter